MDDRDYQHRIAMLRMVIGDFRRRKAKAEADLSRVLDEYAAYKKNLNRK